MVFSMFVNGWGRGSQATKEKNWWFRGTLWRWWSDFHCIRWDLDHSILWNLWVFFWSWSATISPKPEVVNPLGFVEVVGRININSLEFWPPPPRNAMNVLGFLVVVVRILLNPRGFWPHQYHKTLWMHMVLGWCWSKSTWIYRESDHNNKNPLNS